MDINEGVFGLRRAFRAAGADGVVMSLWRVDDAATRAWMRALYDARFAKGLDGASAAVHPYHWAGFVFEGAGASVLTEIGR